MRRRDTARRGRRLLALLVACLQIGCVSSLIYFPDPVVRPIPDPVGLSPEWAFFQAEDGVRLSAWYLSSPGARGTILFLHGNGGNVSHYVPSLALFHRLGFNGFILDYRGYGRSEGTPSEQGTYRDARAAWRHLVEARGIPPDAIVIWGRSLGGAIAAGLARGRAPRLLVLESAFTSLQDVAADLYPWAPTRLLLGSRYPTEAFLREVRAPVLVMHSPDDELAPYAHGLRLFERASPPKRFLPIRGRHNTPQYDGLTPEVLDPRTWAPTAR
ncbi:MAG: alpha/beta hydrolase [Candidatus Methylomirabilales bacterium]